MVAYLEARTGYKCLLYINAWLLLGVFMLNVHFKFEYFSSQFFTSLCLFLF